MTAVRPIRLPAVPHAGRVHVRAPRGSPPPPLARPNVSGSAGRPTVDSCGSVGRPAAASNGKQRVQRRILGSRGGGRHTRSANTPTEPTRSRCRAVPRSPDRVTTSTEGLLRFGGPPVPWCGSVGDRPQRGSTATARTPAMPLVRSTSRHFAQPDHNNQLWRSPSTTSVLQTSKSCLG